jgi:hypothetical protein
MGVVRCRRAVRLTNDNTDGYLQLSKLYHENGQADKSLKYEMSDVHDDEAVFCLETGSRTILQYGMTPPHCNFLSF